MNAIYFMIFLMTSTLAEGPRRIRVIENPQTLEDFDHQFKGCPENSECDPLMGQMMLKWKELVGELQKEEITEAKKAALLESFRSKNGIPTEFYTYESSQLGFKPALHGSSCKNHNPKDPKLKIFRGTSFVKSMGQDKIIIWRDQTQIELTPEELILPQKVLIYFMAGTKSYYLPLGDQPLYIQNQSLYVLREDDGVYYMLKISPEGDWKIVELDPTKLGERESYRQDVKCPEDKNIKKNNVFENEFCKTIWDMDNKKTVVMKLQNGC